LLALARPSLTAIVIKQHHGIYKEPVCEKRRSKLYDWPPHPAAPEDPRDKTDRSRGRLDSKTPIRLRIYEMGGLPRLQILVRLAGALEVAIDRILIGSKK
jgi:hypothetical protein